MLSCSRIHFQIKTLRIFARGSQEAIVRQDISNAVQRFFTATLFLVFSALGTLLSAHATEKYEMIKNIDAGKWEDVAKAVTGKMADKIPTALERKMFEDVVKSSRLASKMAKAFHDKNYNGVGTVSINYITGELGGFIDTRYGANSSVKSVYNLISHNRVLSKKLVQAALNGDPDAAALAMDDAMVEYAKAYEAKLAAIATKNIEFIFKSAVPDIPVGNAYVISPVDLYFQGVSRWAEFARRSVKDVNDAALNCTWAYYRFLRKTGYTQSDAMELVEDLQVGATIGNDGFNCPNELERLRLLPPAEDAGFFAGIWRSVVNVVRPTAVKGKLGISTAKMSELLLEFEAKQIFDNTRTTFPEWVRALFMQGAYKRTRALNLQLEADHAKYQTKQLQVATMVLGLIDEEMRLQGLLSEDDEKDKKKSTATDGTTTQSDADKACANSNQALVGGCDDDAESGTDSATNSGTGSGTTQNPPSTRAACDALAMVLSDTQTQLYAGSYSSTDALKSAVTAALTSARDAGTCSETELALAPNMIGEIGFVEGVLVKYNANMTECSPASLKRQTLTFELQQGFYAFPNPESYLQTALTGWTVFKTARDQYRKDDLDGARQTLARSQSVVNELQPHHCRSLASRIDKAFKRIDALEVIKGRVEQALNTCKVLEIEALIAKHSKANHIYLTDAVQRLRTKLPECRKQQENNAAFKACSDIEGTINSALRHYKNSQFKTARTMLIKARNRMGRAEMAICPKHRKRVDAGLGKIQKLNAFAQQVSSAINACDLKQMENLSNRAGRQNHGYFAKVQSQLRLVKSECSAKASKSTCTTADKTLDSARQAYKSSAFNEARGQLHSIVQRLTKSGAPNCGKTLQRARKGLGNIALIEAEHGKLTAVLKSCDATRLETLASGYRTRNHSWFRKATARIRQGLTRCRATTNSQNSNESGGGNVCARLKVIAGQVRTSLTLGAFEQSLSQLRPARALTQDPTRMVGCEKEDGRVIALQAELSRIIKAQSSINSAVAECQISRFDRLESEFSAQRFAKYSKLANAIKQARRSCAPKKLAKKEPKSQQRITGDQRWDGHWIGKATIIWRKGEFEPVIPFAIRIRGDQISGRTAAEDTEVQAELRGQILGSAMRFEGSSTQGGVTMRLKLKSDQLRSEHATKGKVVGTGRANMPEVKCFLDGMAGVMADAASGGLGAKSKKSAPCPTSWYQIKWSAKRRK